MLLCFLFHWYLTLKKNMIECVNCDEIYCPACVNFVEMHKLQYKYNRMHTSVHGTSGWNKGTEIWSERDDQIYRNWPRKYRLKFCNYKNWRRYFKLLSRKLKFYKNENTTLKSNINLLCKRLTIWIALQ